MHEERRATTQPRHGDEPAGVGPSTNATPSARGGRKRQQERPASTRSDGRASAAPSARQATPQKVTVARPFDTPPPRARAQGAVADRPASPHPSEPHAHAHLHEAEATAPTTRTSSTSASSVSPGATSCNSSTSLGHHQPRRSATTPHDQQDPAHSHSQHSHHTACQAPKQRTVVRHCSPDGEPSSATRGNHTNLC